MDQLHCYDSVTWDAIPNAPVVLSYVDGDYRTWDQLKDHYKGTGTAVISVTVDCLPGAMMADCEAGNAGPVAVANWAKAELKAVRRPTIYGSLDVLQACARTLRAIRINPVLVDWFLADYVQVAPPLDAVDWHRLIPAGYVGWQFADSIPVPGGHTVDASLVHEFWAIRHGYRRHVPPATLPPSAAPQGERFLVTGWYLDADNARRIG